MSSEETRHGLLLALPLIVFGSNKFDELHGAAPGRSSPAPEQRRAEVGEVRRVGATCSWGCSSCCLAHVETHGTVLLAPLEQLHVGVRGLPRVDAARTTSGSSTARTRCSNALRRDAHVGAVLRGSCRLTLMEPSPSMSSGPPRCAAVTSRAQHPTSSCTADGPRGVALWPATPCAESSARKIPLWPLMKRLLVGSPHDRVLRRPGVAQGRLVREALVGAAAPALSTSSPTVSRNPRRRSPRAISSSAARSIARAWPFASQAPRPWTVPPVTRGGMKGGTVSRCVQNTTSGRSARARTL